MASRLRRWGLVGLLALLVAPSGGFAASRIASRYLIVPNHSIAGIVIGEAAGPVVDTIGPPRGRAEPAGPQWLYGALDVWLNSQQLQVLKLVVAPVFGASHSEAARYETSRGIRVGSTIGAVEKAYPAVKCSLKTAGCALNSATRSTVFVVAKSARALTSSTPVLAIEIS
ncbi:MAG TPA: hypothetical protein VHM72_06145 [Solirubrobacteraceae bacterium]|jgi:hypothetical protein|nr:hypothetical protein [Solirubrobacteraceae bacterium]